MAISTLNNLSVLKINDSTRLGLIEWIETTNRFKTSYATLSKTTIKLMSINRSGDYLGQCPRNEPRYLLGLMCQELYGLSHQGDLFLDSNILPIRTDHLKQLTAQADYLISLMNQPV